MSIEQYMQTSNETDNLDVLPTQPAQRTETESQPTLNQSVQTAVEGYFRSMDDEQITDLYELVLSEVEMPLLACVLRRTRNNQSHTAQILGLNRGTLRKKLKKYGML